MRLTAGIDIGSITAKAFDELLAELGLSSGEIVRIIATGYGRKSVSFADKAVTEIMCHAAGARYLDPSVRSLIDIGGQDSKAVVMDENGKVTNFTMNDKCAAGTGRFLEVMARALEADLDEFGALSLKAERPAKISSLCTVFAESEVISLIAKGETRENIIAGIHEAIASRVSAMANRIGLIAPVLMTGGVARNIGVVRALEKVIGMPVVVSPQAQVAGAIGAAALAWENR
ncbi:MAG: acyl-CoA dehydratase activase [Deltaproteobacteria bacterium]|nr:acyl-CoA dehydratase activase [Deltaproteobacteria bacterium]